MYFLSRQLFVNNLARLWHLNLKTYKHEVITLLFNRYRLKDISIMRKFDSATFTMAANTNNLFEGVLDRFNGITVDSEKEPCSDDDFQKKLLESIQYWKQNDRKGIWFNVHLQHASWVPILAKSGFRFHHAKDDKVMMYLWLPKESCNIPHYAHTLVGVGAVVINDKSQLLVVREKHYDYPHWKLPGGYVEPGENLVDAAIREVHEETNIITEFHTVLTLRHTHYGMFSCSDIYVVVGLKPMNDEIAKCEREIAECKWMDIEEYLQHPHVHELNRLFLQKYLDYDKNNIKIDCDHDIHQRLQKPYTLYHVTHTDKNESKHDRDSK